MYSFKQIFLQEPTAISAVFIGIVNVLVVFGLNWTADQIAAVNTALVLILNIFYVRPLTASKAALRSLTARKK